jgi:hypothetical protein
MAFDIGQRVTSKFFGAGTVKSDLFRHIDEDDPQHPVTYQRVKFDKNGIETAVAVAKLYPLDEEEAKPKKLKDVNPEGGSDGS